MLIIFIVLNAEKSLEITNLIGQIIFAETAVRLSCGRIWRKWKMTKQEAYKTFKCWHCVYLDNDKGICLCGDPDSDDCPKDYTAEQEETK